MEKSGLLTWGLIGIILLGFFLTAGCTRSNTTSLPTESSALSNPAQSELKTYSNYNVSFNYPGNMTIIESGFKDNDANFNSGGVIIKNQSDQILILWEKSMGPPANLDGVYLNEFENMKNDANVTNLSIGPVETISHNGDTISTVTIAYTESNQQYHSQAAWWYCPGSDRVFSIDVSTRGESAHAKNMVMTFVDSFRCQ